ncbi:MAG: divergent polysaccharide deacetylase family protein, partial [Thermodesulfobacteriota bacterium]
NRELMQLVLKMLKDENLYFVDSLTSNNSYGSSLATEIGIKFAKRDVFLDDSKKGKNYMINQIENLIEIAEKNGVGVGICHTYKDSIDVLFQYLPKIKDRVEITTVTSIFN